MRSPDAAATNCERTIAVVVALGIGVAGIGNSFRKRHGGRTVRTCPSRGGSMMAETSSVVCYARMSGRPAKSNSEGGSE